MIVDRELHFTIRGMILVFNCNRIVRVFEATFQQRLHMEYKLFEYFKRGTNMIIISK